MDPRTKPLKNHVIVRIAAAADADPKTVRRFSEGFSVRGRVAERIERALRAAEIDVQPEEDAEQT